MDTTIIVFKALAGALFAVGCVAVAIVAALAAVWVVAYIVQIFRALATDSYQWFRRIRRGRAE